MEHAIGEMACPVTQTPKTPRQNHAFPLHIRDSQIRGIPFHIRDLSVTFFSQTRTISRRPSRALHLLLWRKDYKERETRKEIRNRSALVLQKLRTGFHSQGSQRKNLPHFGYPRRTRLLLHWLLPRTRLHALKGGLWRLGKSDNPVTLAQRV
jgi:hypothetical protein